jgi:hypothetical protein
LNSTLGVAGATTLSSTLDVTGATTLHSTLGVAGATTLSSTLDVTGATTLNSTLDVYGASVIHNTLDVTGNLTATGTTNQIGTANVSNNTITGLTNTITGSTSTDITGNNAYLDLYHNTASMGVTNGSTVTATNNQLTAKTVDGSGLTVNNGLNATDNPGATVITLTNSTGHGLTINTDSTVLSGGTHSTSLTLNDWGATFSNNGSPARVTGVADGVNQYDAVNFGQLQKSYQGIASVSALAAIPSTMPGKRFAIGAGYGYFESQSAVALGLKASILDCLSVSAGVGIGVGQTNSDYSANAGISFSF